MMVIIGKCEDRVSLLRCDKILAGTSSATMAQHCFGTGFVGRHLRIDRAIHLRTLFNLDFYRNALSSADDGMGSNCIWLRYHVVSYVTSFY